MVNTAAMTAHSDEAFMNRKSENERKTAIAFAEKNDVPKEHVLALMSYNAKIYCGNENRFVCSEDKVELEIIKAQRAMKGMFEKHEIKGALSYFPGAATPFFDFTVMEYNRTHSIRHLFDKEQLFLMSCKLGVFLLPAWLIADQTVGFNVPGDEIVMAIIDTISSFEKQLEFIGPHLKDGLKKYLLWSGYQDDGFLPQVSGRLNMLSNQIREELEEDAEDLEEEPEEITAG